MLFTMQHANALLLCCATCNNCDAMTQRNEQRDWFLSRIKDTGRTSRELSQYLGMDPSALSRTIKGERQMTETEAAGIARFINEDLETVLRMANLSHERDKLSSIVTLAYEIGPDGTLKAMKEAKALPEAVAVRARSAIGAERKIALAAVVNASEGPMRLMDNSLLIFTPSATMTSNNVGLSILKTDEGDGQLCRITSKRMTGEAVFITPSGEEKTAFARDAYPVVAILP